MQRYSKKRECILACLRSTTEHPDAEWLYVRLKEHYPDLSLATVYRNLKQLEEEGVIISLGTVKGRERYDATITPHIHAVCTLCGRVIDLEFPHDTKHIAENVVNKSGYHMTSFDIRLSGVCADCYKQMPNGGGEDGEESEDRRETTEEE